MTKTEFSPQFSPELQQQINVLNARINNATFAQADLFKEINNTFTTMIKTINDLQQENAELKTKMNEEHEKPEK